MKNKVKLTCDQPIYDYQLEIVGEGCSCKAYKARQRVTAVYGINRLIDYDMNKKKVIELYSAEDDFITEIKCYWCGKMLYCRSRQLLTCCRGDLF